MCQTTANSSQTREKLRAAIKKGQGIEKEKNAAVLQIQELQQRVQQLEEDVVAAKCAVQCPHV